MIDRTALRDVHMVEGFFAPRLVALSRRRALPLWLVKLLTRSEKGQLTSRSLRVYLAQRCGVTVGSYSYGSLLDPGMSDRGLTIGRYVSIGPNVRRFGAAHPVSRLSMHPFWYNPALRIVGRSGDVDRAECVIEHESWIGANVTILPACRRIGIGAVIGAGTVVTKDVPDFAIVVGNPGRVMQERLTPAIRKLMLEREPWLQEPVEAADAFSQIAKDAGDESLFVSASEAPEYVGEK